MELNTRLPQKSHTATFLPEKYTPNFLTIPILLISNVYRITCKWDECFFSDFCSLNNSNVENDVLKNIPYHKKYYQQVKDECVSICMIAIHKTQKRTNLTTSNMR